MIYNPQLGHRVIYACILLIAGLVSAQGQSKYFGINGGPTIAFQKWNGFQESNPLLTYHLKAHVESYGQSSAFFANAGISNKGRGIRYNDFVSPISGGLIRGGYVNVVFKNVELTLGLKKYFELNPYFEFFYSFGLRGSYTYDAKYGQIDYITNDATRKWNYGVSAGGGIRWSENEFFRPLLHIIFSPDLSQQVKIPAQEYVSPSGGTYVLAGQEIRNISLEIGFTLQFLRKVIYRE
ncbi:hypothetical protein [Membranihabitans marinus]|uniref:hypothetical protein n=1 Tax=Membranihabitans marinus TaxID=1227546 RepID=UPI001F3C8D08|nr:hypothetical protein [Membranihabitans marinus]